jgi:hypothetical protein
MAIISMMEKTKCRRLITTYNYLNSLIDRVETNFVSQGQLQIDEVPALKDLYPALVMDPSNGALSHPVAKLHSHLSTIYHFMCIPRGPGSTSFL